MFATNIAAGILGSYLLLYMLGRVVEYLGIKVNYTRKIYHFALIFYGLYGWTLIPYEVSTQTDSIWGLVSTLSLLIFIKPLREHIPLIRHMFRAIDRPEDRPHTLLLSSIESRNLLVIPMLVVGFGDGLAEPVGVRFGRHQYQVPAFLSPALWRCCCINPPLRPRSLPLHW